MKLYQHDDTGRMTWAGTEVSPRLVLIPTMYEDELPSDISDSDYDAWYVNSCVVDGVRMGPKI